jgi:sigma factor-binding protein Crl
MDGDAMTSTTLFPPHGRLMTKLTALGPYIREKKSQEGYFFFDCLASCINAEKEPEHREFWGWWLVLTAEDNGFEYCYDIGRYDINGEWNPGKLPAKHKEAVMKTLIDFYAKLQPFIIDDCNLSLSPSVALEQKKLTELV